jgi:WD40 repeat protein
MAWETATGKPLVSRRLVGSTFGQSSHFSPDGGTVAFPRPDGLALQDVLTGEDRLVLPGELGAPLAFSADGQILAAAIYQHQPPGNRRPYRIPSEIEAVGFWEVATGQAIGQVKTGPVAQVAFAPGGRLLAAAGAGALHVWDIAAGDEVLRLTIEPVNSRVYSSSVVSLAFSPTGRSVATGMVDGTILVWDVSAARTAAARRRHLDDKELIRFWTDLAGEAPAAEDAVAALSAASVQAVALLR